MIERASADPKAGSSAPPPRLAALPLAAADGRVVRVATSARSRLIGLAFTDRERVGAGLLIPGCRSIHTFGMRFAIDVAFLDAEGRVLSRRRALPRRRLVIDLRASAVLEVPAGGGA